MSTAVSDTQPLVRRVPAPLFVAVYGALVILVVFGVAMAASRTTASTPEDAELPQPERPFNPAPADPGNVAAVREVLEETGVRVTAAAILGVGAHGPVTHANGDKASYMTVQLRCEPLDPTADPVVGDDENTEAGWFPISQMPVTDPKWRLAIADAASQRRHPGSFAPRMGLTKR